MVRDSRCDVHATGQPQKCLRRVFGTTPLRGPQQEIRRARCRCGSALVLMQRRRKSLSVSGGRPLSAGLACDSHRLIALMQRPGRSPRQAGCGPPHSSLNAVREIIDVRALQTTSWICSTSHRSGLRWHLSIASPNKAALSANRRSPTASPNGGHDSAPTTAAQARAGGPLPRRSGWHSPTPTPQPREIVTRLGPGGGTVFQPPFRSAQHPLPGCNKDDAKAQSRVPRRLPREAGSSHRSRSRVDRFATSCGAHDAVVLSRRLRRATAAAARIASV